MNKPSCKKNEEILLRESNQFCSYRLLRDMRGEIFRDEDFKKNVTFLEQVKNVFLEKGKR